MPEGSNQPDAECEHAEKRNMWKGRDCYKEISPNMLWDGQSKVQNSVHATAPIVLKQYLFIFGTYVFLYF